MVAQPPDPEIEKLLAQLRSADSGRRQAAAERVVKRKLRYDEIIKTLKAIAETDPEVFVQYAAKNALRALTTADRAGAVPVNRFSRLLATAGLICGLMAPACWALFFIGAMATVFTGGFSMLEGVPWWAVAAYVGLGGAILSPIIALIAGVVAFLTVLWGEGTKWRIVALVGSLLGVLLAAINVSLFLIVALPITLRA